MIYEVLLKKFGYDEPIFSSEILDLFKQFTKAYVFRVLNKEIEEGKIAKFDQGVYYIPQDTDFGKSLISPNAVAQKKYISNGEDVYGVISGLTLAYRFRLTEQVPLRMEIVSDKESSKGREIDIDGRKYFVKRPRLKITKENADVYAILQLYTEFDTNEFNKRVMEEIKEYMAEKNVTTNDLFEMLPYFPSKTSKRLIETQLLR